MTPGSEPPSRSGVTYLSAWTLRSTTPQLTPPDAGQGSMAVNRPQERADRMKPMSEDWNSAVAVAAHPGDLDDGAAAAVARGIRQGKHVCYVLVSSGEAGIAGQDPAKVGPLREQEERRGA